MRALASGRRYQFESHRGRPPLSANRWSAGWIHQCLHRAQSPYAGVRGDDDRAARAGDETHPRHGRGNALGFFERERDASGRVCGDATRSDGAFWDVGPDFGGARELPGIHDGHARFSSRCAELSPMPPRATPRMRARSKLFSSKNRSWCRKTKSLVTTRKQPFWRWLREWSKAKFWCARTNWTPVLPNFTKQSSWRTR